MFKYRTVHTQPSFFMAGEGDGMGWGGSGKRGKLIEHKAVRKVM